MRYVFAFDLDDTLYLERDYVDACLQHVAETFNIDKSVLKSGVTPYDGLLTVRPNVAIEEFLAVYRSTEPARLPLREGVTDFLQSLDHKPYIITDGRSFGQRAKIRALGLDRFFAPDHIIISEKIGADKTTPTPFLSAQKREPQDTQWIYVADNPKKDFLFPNRLGWLTFMLRDLDGSNIHPQTDVPCPHAPHHIINTLSEIPQFLNR